MSDHLEKLIQLISICLDVPAQQILTESDIIKDLGADSLDAVNIQREIKDTFHVELTDKDFEKVNTVGDLAELIRSHLNFRDDSE